MFRTRRSLTRGCLWLVGDRKGADRRDRKGDGDAKNGPVPLTANPGSVPFAGHGTNNDESKPSGRRFQSGESIHAIGGTSSSSRAARSKERQSILQRRQITTGCRKLRACVRNVGTCRGGNRQSNSVSLLCGWVSTESTMAVACHQEA